MLTPHNPLPWTYTEDTDEQAGELVSADNNVVADMDDFTPQRCEAQDMRYMAQAATQFPPAVVLLREALEELNCWGCTQVQLDLGQKIQVFLAELDAPAT